VIFPGDGAVMRREDLEFRWDPLPNTIFYEVWITTAEGELVFEQKTEAQKIKLEPGVALSSGTSYFFSVRAHLREGKTAKSSILNFRISDR
jgi:hypothetical protein